MPALSLDALFTRKLTVKEMNEVGRSFNRDTLTRIMDLLTHVRVVTKSHPLQEYLPLEMEDRDLFGCLPHLLVPGCQFSFMSSVRVAMIIVYAGIAVLYDRALSFLESARGKWFDPEAPENYSMSFVRFALDVNGLAPEVFTDDELVFLRNLAELGGLWISRTNVLDAYLPYGANKTVISVQKEPCKTCNVLRHDSLILPGNVCAFCHGKLDPTPCRMDDRACMCECRTCKSLYAVESPEDLNVTPKCHYCRENESSGPPTVKCVTCLNLFVNPRGHLAASGPWACFACENSLAPAKELVQVDVATWTSLRGSPYSTQISDDFFVSSSLFVAARRYSALKSSNDVDTRRLKGKTVTNAAELDEVVASYVKRSRADRGTCMICFGDDFKKSDLVPVCGRRGCSTLSCRDCLDGWYGALKPGAIVTQSNIECPFCKKTPTTKILNAHNKEMVTLRIVDEVDYDNYVNAWCIGCYAIRPAYPKACGDGGGGRDLTGFRCDGCLNPGAEYPCKACPSCGVLTEKTSGCDHMTCTCGAHWCFECGARSTYEDIYVHMSREHGGYGIVHDGSDDEEDGW